MTPTAALPCHLGYLKVLGRVLREGQPKLGPQNGKASAFPKTTMEARMDEALRGDLRNPIVRWAVEVADLEGRLAYAREQYNLARGQETA